MIRIEADKEDLRQLAKISGGISNQLTNLRITEGAQIAFEVIQKGIFKPDVAVKANIAKASDTSLDVDFTLGAKSAWVPNWFISGMNKLAWWIDDDLGSKLEKQCPGIVRRRSSSSISFNVPALCEKLNIPLTVSVANVSLQNRQLTLTLKLE